MNSTLLYNADARIPAAMLFAGIILFYFFGLKAFQQRKKKNPEHTSNGIGTFEGAMLGLISLLLAFTFNQSASHYDKRRDLLIHETNCIGTVLLRSGLYPDSVQQLFRNDTKEYIHARISYYDAGGDEKEIQSQLHKANEISERMWKRAADVSQQDDRVVKSMQMLPAINDMVDAVSTREEARNAHVPASILGLLFFFCLAGSFIVGYACKSKKADWIILLSYSFMTVATIYLILDLDQPRRGIINTKATHQSMNHLLDTFNAGEGEKK